MKNEAGLIPTGTRIVVRPEKVKTTTQSGLVLVDHTVEAEQLAGTRGIVIDVGASAPALPEMKGIEVGDLIFFAKYAGHAISFARKGVLYRLMDGRDVLGKVEAEFDSQFQAARTTAETFGIDQEAVAASGS